MTVSFFKLHVAGDDFILVDRTRPGHEVLRERPDTLAPLAQAICDRCRGVGGRGVAFIGPDAAERKGALSVRIFAANGTEKYEGEDAYLCVARWATDSGRAAGGKVRLTASNGGEHILSALDSRSFAVELPAPRAEENGRMELLLDGRPETAFIFRGNGRWAATIGRENSPTPKRVRDALAVAIPDAIPVIARPAGRDLIRFSTIYGADRFGAAAAAVAAGIAAGRTDESAVAEWRGKGAAVAYANFASHSAKSGAAAGPGTLIDRGRFFVEWKSPEKILIAGLAEYSFEGHYDHDA
ncbi:MAG: hypothetical protein WCT14_04325 [Treponemataceae bacterium]